MPRSTVSLKNKNSILSENSWFLRERRDLVSKSLLLDDKDDKCDWSPKVIFKPLLPINYKSWSAEVITKEFNLNLSTSNWENIWDKFFSNPFYFYSSSSKLIDQELNNSLFCKSPNNIYLESSRQIQDMPYTWAEQYSDLLNTQELKQEIINKYKRIEEENLLSELTKLDLTIACEELSTKFEDKKEELEKTEEEQVTTFKKSSEWKPPVLEVRPPKIKLPLDNSLPSMFLSFLHSKEFAESSVSPLKDTPKWIKKINSLINRWSISRYIPEERTKALFSPLDLNTLNKQNVQWQDPQEKWFYYSMPLINLFFDRYREKYKKSLVTIWEEPEYTFPLTEIELCETANLFKAKYLPVFCYKGVPALEINKDLELVESLIEIYGKHSEKQAKKELEEEGFAEVQLGSSFNSDDLLSQLKREEQEI
ncbi:hypothetical protein OVS_03710 [Mycoplasma ovis str. Michigan]|uniref:Uncharacterized protein n=1 Tax=Mycoplasma ovis str. Michigan TaxID=1415773 RepID=A0ABN4BRG5_9MOLU|nr:hypothetical protein [Mycoplasma ovis]AHC40488.1 hypothetical protein OVS_03710 [Mycoplasma ovis str. Michigan]